MIRGSRTDAASSVWPEPVSSVSQSQPVVITWAKQAPAEEHRALRVRPALRGRLFRQ